MPQETRQPPYLSDTAVRDLTDLIDNGQQIPRVLERANHKAATSVYRLSCRIADELDLSRSGVHDILLGLLNINRLRRGLDGAEIFDLITTSLQDQCENEWKDEYLHKWLDLKAEIVSAVNAMGEDHPFVVSQKAESLLYCDQNVFISCRIVTDARPIFDEKGETILGTTIVHSLSAHYSTGNHKDHATINIAMDTGNIDELQQACVRQEKGGRSKRTFVWCWSSLIGVN